MREGGKILVVDDSTTVLDRIRVALSAHGYAVHVTTDPAEAAYQVPSSDLVIVDFHMPEVDGGQLLPSLRRSVTSNQICLFYLYTSDVEVARKYQRLGFDGGLLRKGDTQALLPQVEAVFRTIRMRKLAADLKARRIEGPRR